MVTVLYSDGLSALGIGEDTRYARYSYVGPERTYPYALMTICDVQRHLVAARVLPRSGVDGIWGPQSRNALYEFIKTMPLAAVRAVYTDNQDRGNLAPFGREDYRLIGSTQIRIPQAYVMAFPPKANVTCRRATPTGTTGGGTTDTSTGAGTTTSTSVTTTEEQNAGDDATTTTVTDETGPSLEEQLAASQRDEAPASGGFSPWLILAGVALGVLAISASRSR